jgi:starvation-inducible DNA-binding protein
MTADFPTATELLTPTSLPNAGREAISSHLNRALANAFALYLKTKNFHWHVSGPHFRDYHLLLDSQAAQIIATTDRMAERVRKIGGTTLRSIGDIQRRQSLADNDIAFVQPSAMLLELKNDNLKLIKELRELKDFADAARDNATSALADELTDQAEERAWFLFETGRSTSV